MATELELVADGFTFLEAPRWRDGRLFVSDFYAHVVRSISPTGEMEVVCEVPGQPSGLGFTPTGEMLVVSMLDRKLMRFGAEGLVEVAEIGDRSPGRLNDMVVDARGRAYVGNFGAEPTSPTPLFRVDPDGSVHVAAIDVVFPNGCVIVPGGREMLLAETFAFRITAFEVAADGWLGRRRPWARFTPDAATSWEEVEASNVVAPDGIALDAAGALWVPDAKAPGLIRVAEGGEVLDRLDTGNLAAYAVAFGGPDGQDLYVCAAPPLGVGDPESEHRSVLLRGRVDVPGAGFTR